MRTEAINDSGREEKFRAFLDAHLEQEMLRFTTAGSVDDGKSTLIGRLLHDTRSVYEDQLAAVRASRVNRAGAGRIDLSLLTDGLKAEREQGITIDVAYRYFSTAKRKFIIADTPGHEQYTRNMATGASTADVALVLIDANAFLKAGTLLPQSRRHMSIGALLRIPHVVAAVNKMDLAGYDEAVFAKIAEEFHALAAKLGLRSVEAVPVSALAGDNVVEPSTAMPWYKGPTLLEYLETVPLRVAEEAGPLRFPVQLVVRPDGNFRGFAGRVERGELRAGQPVIALPSGKHTRVKSIVTYDGNLKSAIAPQSVTVELEDEIDLSRGEMLIAEGETAPRSSTRLSAMVVWMNEQPLTVGQTLLAKHTTRTVRATVQAIRYRVDIVTAEHNAAQSLHMNDIAEVEFSTGLPLFFDSYTQNRSTGSFILMDALTNATVGAGMIVEAVAEVEVAVHEAGKPALILVQTAEAAHRRQTVLHDEGARAVIIDDVLIPDSALIAVVRALQLANVTAISSRRGLGSAELEALRLAFGEQFVEDGQ
jgi:bifunctional enzyme CysN/CysC/sulfate adenylyltransferase subunit 1